MRSSFLSFSIVLILGGLTLLSGCADRVSAEIQELRKRWLVSTPPPNEIAVSAVRAQWKAGELTADSKVVVRARINAGEMPPWGEGRAEFFITDAMGHDGDEDHNPHECPFCKRNVMDSMAQVRLTGADGKTLPIDARELLGVREFSLLVIRATVTPEDSDLLVLNADQICILPSR